MGDRIQGVVTRVMDFGAFVEIEPGVEGLIHLSEMSWAKKVRKPSDVLKPGDTVEAAVLGVNMGERRLFTVLSDLGWIYKGADQRWHIYQRTSAMGRLRPRPSWRVNEETGEKVANVPTVRVTPRGLHDLHQKLGGSGPLLLSA